MMQRMSSRVFGRMENLRRHFFVRGAVTMAVKMYQDRQMKFYIFWLAFILLLAIFGPAMTPYEYDNSLRDENGEIARYLSPSLEHPLGTNDLGYDVLSRLIYGARPTVVTGLLGGAIIISIGGLVGLVSGYYGGWVENVLMRTTDFAYSVPLIPFAIVLLALMGKQFLLSVVIIGLILWRGSARVIRSQVLQIKERPFIMSARATGASDRHIIVNHIVPNIVSMAVLFFAFGIGGSIMVQAGLAFVGVVDPFVPSWGIMLRRAYGSGRFAEAIWWSIPPGIFLSLTVLSAFMFGRKFEELAGGEVDDKGFV